MYQAHEEKQTLVYHRTATCFTEHRTPTPSRMKRDALKVTYTVPPSLNVLCELYSDTNPAYVEAALAGPSHRLSRFIVRVKRQTENVHSQQPINLFPILNHSELSSLFNSWN